MQTLRNASLLARLVLAWFVLSLGVAVAAPVVTPSGMELICSGGTMKLVVQGSESDNGSTGGKAWSHTLECPLCASLDAPPSFIQVEAPFVAPLGHVVQPVPAARIAALTAAPLPARGPPSAIVG